MLDRSQHVCNFAKGMLLNRFLVTRSVWACVGAVVLALVLATHAFAGSFGASFSDDEWRKLEAGELVARRQTSRRDGLELIGGSSWQVIDAPPDAVFRALLDTGHYTRMMPQVLEAKLVAERGAASSASAGTTSERTVFVRQGQKGIAEKRYYLRLNVNETKRDITFAVDDARPHDLRAAWGFYTVRPYKDGKTLLAYGILADLGGGILESVFGDEIHEWMLKTPWMVKRFVEGSGRKLYD